MTKQELWDTLNDYRILNNKKPFKYFPDGDAKAILKAEMDEYVASEYAKTPARRKTQILTILQQGPVSMSDLSSRLNISRKNISSVLTYLRKAGSVINTFRNKATYFVELQS